MMKKVSIMLFVWILNMISVQTFAQTKQAPDSLGLPGDNLNLYAVMKLFQESETLEGFEKKLNTESSKVNNLDLNGDNKIDYIRVIDNVDGKVHNIVMQVPVTEKENQDVAVFIVEKNDKGEVQIQLVGDEDLYGKDYIIEPNYTDNAGKGETPNPGYTKTSSTKQVDENGNTTIINNYTAYETAAWPVVTYIYTPSYVVWVSPWHYWYYPPYWNPWTPWYWHHYYGYHYHWHHHYYGHYHHPFYYRSPGARTVYYGQRRSSSITYNSRRQAGEFKGTYAHPETRKDGSALYKKDNVAKGERVNSGEKGNSTNNSNSKADNNVRGNGSKNEGNNNYKEKPSSNSNKVNPSTSKPHYNNPKPQGQKPSGVKPSNKPVSPSRSAPRQSSGSKSSGGKKGGR